MTELKTLADLDTINWLINTKILREEAIKRIRFRDRERKTLYEKSKLFYDVSDTCELHRIDAVSYTHLTLPTILLV